MSPTSTTKNFGVLLVNMGGPQKSEDMAPYLLELFSDPDIIQLPLGFIYQKILARRIAKKRAPLSWEKYEKIGGIHYRKFKKLEAWKKIMEEGK